MNRHRSNRNSLLLVVLVAAVSVASASDVEIRQHTEEKARAALEQATGEDWIVDVAPTGGTIIFAAPKDGAYESPRADSHIEAALAFLSRHRRIFGMQDPRREWIVTPRDAAMSGPTHVRFSQVVNGVPVYGASWIMHFDSRGRLTSTSGGYVVGALEVSTRARLSAEAAAARARACVAARARLPESTFKTNVAELEIFPLRNARPSLAWHVLVSVSPPRPIILSREVHLDDRTGTVLADTSMVRFRSAPQEVDPKPTYPAQCLLAGQEAP
ncbi:hypothetical protein [Thermomonas sp.]|uniref:hypothetical protein n=1 Tax=Thermomonas sp. TaxID=1971895 RepID=UPI00260329D4|nr:hypothetical protein [Thermomonas sp.]